MEDRTKKLIQGFYEQLTPELQKIVLSSDLNKKLLDVTKKNNVRVDQAAVIENEVVLLLLGMSPPKDFTKHLANRAHMSREEAQIVADDIDQNIFQPIREELKSVWETDTKVSKQGTQSHQPEEEGGPVPHSTNNTSGAEHPKKAEVLEELNKPQKKTEELLGLKRSMPKDVEQEKEVETKQDLADAGVFAGASKIAEEKMTKPTNQSATYKGVDPYREPIE